jgi:hypothetical protein
VGTLEITIDKRAQALSSQLAQSRPASLEGVPNRLGIDFRLRSEVVIEGASRQSRIRHQVIDADLRETLEGKEPRRAFQDL